MTIDQIKFTLFLHCICWEQIRTSAILARWPRPVIGRRSRGTLNIRDRLRDHYDANQITLEHENFRDVDKATPSTDFWKYYRWLEAKYRAQTKPRAPEPDA